MNAYENLGKIIEQSSPEDLDDKDEVNARKAFKDVNFTTENISSFTVNIDTNMVKSIPRYRNRLLHGQLCWTEFYIQPVITVKISNYVP